jgi:hypothetical protein
MSQPSTTLHYAPNLNFLNGEYAPSADGFNMADVTSASELSELPSGDKALVWLGPPAGVTAAFIAAVQSYIGSSQVYGFYLADVPSASATTAAELKAESNWIHTHDPGVKTFMAEENLSGPLTPKYYYAPANTHIDLFGLDPYPAQTNVPNNYDLNVINLAVKKAESIGIPQKDLVPVYQAFGGGGYASYILPTATQEGQILSRWGSLLPNPAFDYAYSWGVQLGDTAISDDSALQKVFAAHNRAGAAASFATAAANVAAAENSISTVSGGDLTAGGNANDPSSFELINRAATIADFVGHMDYFGSDNFSALDSEFASIVALLGTGSNIGFNSANSGSDGHEHMLSALNVTAAPGLKATGVVQYDVGHGPGP